MGSRPGVVLAAALLAAGASACADGTARTDAAAPAEVAPSGTPAPQAGKADKPRVPRTSRPERLDVPKDLEELAASYNAGPAPAPPQTGKDVRTFGADVSWPQCPRGMGIPEKRTQGQPMPTDVAEFVIIGLTNGPSFVANPCLADQVAWVRERGLMAAAYAVHSFPDAATLAKTRKKGPYDGRTRLGALRNSGYQSALFNLRSMREAGLDSPIVWIDVEPVPTFEWSSDRVANAAVIEGAARGYEDSGLQIGFYSLPSMWEAVVGDLRFGKPEWRAAGMTSMDEALERCGPDWSFQGGPAIFGQWVEDDRDRNVTCPGQGRDVGRWFQRF